MHEYDIYGHEGIWDYERHGWARPRGLNSEKEPTKNWEREYSIALKRGYMHYNYSIATSSSTTAIPPSAPIAP